MTQPNAVRVVKLTAYVTPETHTAMKVEAAKRGVTLGYLIEQAFSALVASPS